MNPPIIVYCDFDGTVSQGDVVDRLLTELADPRWKEIETRWEQGLIGSRECLAQQIPLIRGGWPAIAEELRHVTLDPTFRAFAAWCRTHGVPLRIVSDGLDRVIHTLLVREEVTVEAIWSNHLEETPDGSLSISFPCPSEYVGCRAGLCKCQILDQAAPGALRVIIGDGQSDICWAQRADWLFAKSGLLAYCRAHRIPCTAFDQFDTIRSALELALGWARQPSLWTSHIHQRSSFHLTHA